MLSDITEWDIHTWSKGILYWDDVIDQNFIKTKQMKVLDIGARDGGTSLFFALKGLNCVCSDVNGPSEKARRLHEQYGVTDRMSYDEVDCTRMDFTDNCFDIVAFKSVMGSVGNNNNFDNIDKAFHEIYRVLKPGGILLFCENTQGCFLHMYLRKKFVKWSNSWNYLTLDYMTQAINRFSEHRIYAYGFLSCIIRDNTLVKWVDDKLCQRIKPHNQYMCYGYAKK